jgi:hypothetical protein
MSIVTSTTSRVLNPRLERKIMSAAEAAALIRSVIYAADICVPGKRISFESRTNSISTERSVHRAARDMS